MTRAIHPYPADFEMEEVADPGEGGPVFGFPDPPPERVDLPFAWEEPSRLCVRFRRPDGTEWTGVFHHHYPTPAATCVTTMPDPRRAAVVASGRGTLVDVEEPARSEVVHCNVILHVLPLVARGLIVFVDMSGLCAYGKAGLLWETIDFLIDDIEIGEVVDDALVVRAWTIWGDQDTVAVDLATGRTSSTNFRLRTP